MATKKRIESEEEQVGQATHVDVPVAGVLDRSALAEEGFETVDEQGWDDYAAQLAFMEEPVKIMLAESTDPNAQPLEVVGVNGQMQYLARGVEQVVKRKYVQVLCDMRETSIRTSTPINRDGEVVNRIDKHTAVRYPFSVIEDRNPRGAAWLRAQLAKA